METTSEDPQTGDPVIVVDHAGAVVCWGVFNADSMYRVRVLQMAWEVDVAPAPNGTNGVVCDVAQVVDERVAAAARLREDLGVANDETNVYRLINSEGDRLSGLCVDIYGGDVAVASVSAAWVDFNREAVVKAIGAHVRVDTVVWRVDAKMIALELGRGSRKDGDDEEEDAPNEAQDTLEMHCYYDAKTGEQVGAPSGGVEVTEGGVKYAVDLEKGHKTARLRPR